MVRYGCLARVQKQRLGLGKLILSQILGAGIGLGLIKFRTCTGDLSSLAYAPGSSFIEDLRLLFSLGVVDVIFADWGVCIIGGLGCWCRELFVLYGLAFEV